MLTTTQPYVALKHRLENGRRNLEERLRSLRHTLPPEILEVRDAEEQSFDDHLQAVNVALIEMRSETLRQIEEAMRRLESGTYRSCVGCGGEIPWARLRALPFAPLCRACQEADERWGVTQGRGLPRAGRRTGASARGKGVWRQPRGDGETPPSRKGIRHA